MVTKNKLTFHKYFTPATQVKEVEVAIDTLTDLHLYLVTFFPKFLSEINSQQTVKYDILVNGKPIPQSWQLQNKILDKSATIYIVPSIRGGTDSFFQAVQTFDVSKFLLQATIATSINFALSFVIQAILPKPKKQENQDRQDNDMFGSILNTIDSGVAIPLNYGLIRVGGQIVSSDIEVLTQQRTDDPQQEETISEVVNTQESSSALSGINTIEVGEASSWGNSSTTDYQGSGLTPDQF